LPQLPFVTAPKAVLYVSVPSRFFMRLCAQKIRVVLKTFLCSVERLALNDTGLEVQIAVVGFQHGSGGDGRGGEGGKRWSVLGPGIRVHFQGLLHVKVFRHQLTDGRVWYLLRQL
jgi:hypothetical protein